MDDLLGASLLVLMLAGPVVGYQLAARDPRTTRARILTGSILGGATVALVIAVCALTASPAARLDALPYAVGAVAVGAAIGIAGLLARSFGTWLSR